jgi:hypothetical protein
MPERSGTSRWFVALAVRFEGLTDRYRAAGFDNAAGYGHRYGPVQTVVTSMRPSCGCGSVEWWPDRVLFQSPGGGLLDLTPEPAMTLRAISRGSKLP